MWEPQLHDDGNNIDNDANGTNGGNDDDDGVIMVIVVIMAMIIGDIDVNGASSQEQELNDMTKFKTGQGSP